MATAYLRPDSVRANPTLQSVPRSVLLRQIARACAQHGIAETRFGIEAMRDPRFVFDLRKGREPSGRSQARVLAYLATLNGEA